MRTLCLALAACVIGLSGEASLAQDRDGLVVRTESGPVRGVHNSAVEAFLGIPYATPRSAIGAGAPRSRLKAGRMSGKRRPSVAYCAAAKRSQTARDRRAEDCTRFIPMCGGRSVNVSRRRQSLPVYRVHPREEEFINGSSNQADMTDIVEKTGVLGVSFNYRLGPLGFFSHPDVAKDSGDFGLMDQQAALRWVHENITAFGVRSVTGHAIKAAGVRRRLFGLRASGRTWFGRPLCSGDDAERFVHQHSCGCSAKGRRRDRRRGRVQRAGRSRLPARRSGGQAHRRAPIPGVAGASDRRNRSPAGCASQSGSKNRIVQHAWRS